jgi:hypothetical protein
MRFELPGLRNHRGEILEAPELLRIEPKGLKLSVITKTLLVFTMSLFYSMFMYGSIQTILTSTRPGKQTFVTAFVVLAVMITAALIFLIPVIIKDKRTPLVFTEKGIAGTGFFNAKYENIGTYGWETCSSSFALGQTSGEKNITLTLTSNKGLFPELAYRNRFGSSVLGTYCYFFNPSQIVAAEEILNKCDIKKSTDKT